MNQKEINALASKIIEASDAYYNDQPIMSDEEFDSLQDQLARINRDHPVLATIGAKIRVDSKLETIIHRIPMMSLKKVKTEEEFLKWVERTGAKKFVIQEKLDGVSVEIEYKQGVFSKASTRGTGETGEDITHNVRFMRGVLLELPSAFTGSLRGEIMLAGSDFEEHFSGDDYSNPRNTVSGLSRKKTTDSRVGCFCVKYYDCKLYRGEVLFTKESNKFLFISDKLGLDVAPYHVVSIENAKKWYRHYVDGARANLDYEIDGLVIKVDNLEAQEALGVVSGTPKGQIAWKFESQEAETILMDVQWQVGRTGRITPVAILKPVNIGGVTITRASLHNWKNIQSLDLRHDRMTVIVSRRNDVIPYIEEVVMEEDALGGYIIVPPELCPVCKHENIWEGDFLVCNNKSCGARQKGNIEKWIDKLDLKDLGSAFLDDMLNADFIADAADLYTLSVEQISSLSGYGIKKAKNIIGNLDAKRELTLAEFLAALNISGVGTFAFNLLVDNGLDTLQKIRSATIEELSSMKGIGPVLAEAICHGLADKQDLIEKFFGNGIIIKTQEEKDMSNGILSGKSFCFTGALSIKRKQAQKVVGYLGGEVKTSVTKGLTYLVQADPDSNSTKSQKARGQGTSIIDEGQFLELTGLTADKFESYMQ